MSTGDALQFDTGPLSLPADQGSESLTRKDRAALRPPWRQPLAVIGGVTIVVWTVVAIFAPELAPHPPNLQFGPLQAAPFPHLPVRDRRAGSRRVQSRPVRRPALDAAGSNAGRHRHGDRLHRWCYRRVLRRDR